MRLSDAREAREQAREGASRSGLVDLLGARPSDDASRRSFADAATPGARGARGGAFRASRM